MTDYSRKVKNLFDNQLTGWSLARDNYKQLDNVRVRKIRFDGYETDSYNFV